MSKDAHILPHLGEGPFLSDGGIETTMIFHRGIDLPEFASFVLLEDEDGIAELRRYYEPYIRIARERGLGFVLESPTWRASSRWGERLGYSPERLDEINRRAIEFMKQLRDENGDAGIHLVVSGCLGPQGDGYSPEELLSADESQEYHSPQIRSFAAAGADMVAAMTLTYPEEAIGIARAAADAGIPCAISFTVETDGRLPNGDALADAIERTDAETDGYPAYFMVNCAHPTHFENVLSGPWTERIAGVRANASTMSHAELDEAQELDDGDPEDLGRLYIELRGRLPRLRLLGGCCGTDDRHVSAIAAAWEGDGS